MAGVRKHGNIYQGWYKDHLGQRRWFPGLSVETKGAEKFTLNLARKKEDEHRLIAAGHLPIPKPADKPRSFKDVEREYLSWGHSQGGRGGRPWTPDVYAKHQMRLNWWGDRLNLETLSDIRLAQVEKALQELQRGGRDPRVARNRKQCRKGFRGKTLNHWRASLWSMCEWAVGRGYLERHPLEGLQPFAAEPGYERAAPPNAILERILDAAPRAEIRTLIEVALLTGYRSLELRRLKVRDLDAKAHTLNLTASQTKGRKDSRQPISPALAEKLAQLSSDKPADAPLLGLPRDPVRWLYVAIRAAKVAVEHPGKRGFWLDGKKLDLHALRTTYTTMMMEAGASVKETQAAARHASAQTTMAIYAKVRGGDRRLHDLAEKVSDMIGLKACATGVPKVAVGAETLDVTAADAVASSVQSAQPTRGSNPRRDANNLSFNSSAETQQPLAASRVVDVSRGNSQSQAKQTTSKNSSSFCATRVPKPIGGDLHALKWRVISRLDSARPE